MRIRLLSLFFRYLFIWGLLVLVLEAKAQLNIKIGEHYMDNVSIKKLHVCVEDHSVWVLTDGGKVYFKKSADVDFTIYPNTSNLIITGLSGFNANEMYFISGLQLLKVTEGIESWIHIPFPGFSRINEIAVFHGKDKDNSHHLAINKKDFLTIATNKDLYFLIRGDDVITLTYNPPNPYSVNEPDFQISHSGFKGQDYRYLHPMLNCGIDVDRMTNTMINGPVYWSMLPDKIPYPEGINATITGYHLFQPFLGNRWNLIYNLWATDDGVYLKTHNSSCTNPDIRKHLSGMVINALENIYGLTPIHKQDYILAGSNEGIFYTKRTIFSEQNSEVPSLDHLKFDKLDDFPSMKVTAIKAETAVLGVIGGGQEQYFSLCEKVVWVASERGVYRLYLSLDQEYYKKLEWSDMQYDMLPSNQDFSKPVFQLCGNQTVKAKTRIPTNFANQILFQWFKDGIEIPVWLGKMEAILSDPGVYTIKVTSLCEQITIISNPITILKDELPDVTFNYPAQMTICEGRSVTLSTINNASYKYKWFKDGVVLPAETRNLYVAFIPGVYHVEVSNCAGQYISSSTVKLNIDILPKPILLHDKTIYCKGDVAILSVDNPFGFRIRWDYAGSEMLQFRDQTTIVPPGEGKYMVTYINENGCIKQSDAYDFFTQPLPSVDISRSTNKTLCYGEHAKLSVTATPGATYLWNSGATSREIMVNDPGKYWVEVTSIAGCKAVSDEVEVLVNNQILLAKPPDTKICKIKGERLKLVAEEGYLFYNWNGQKGTSNVLEVNESGRYNLEVEDNNGCKATIVFNVLPKCNSIIAPTAFSPNGDGINDVWTLSGLEDDPNAKIAIYNRYGALVFSTSGNRAFWDGSTKNGKAPVSTYYFLIHTIYSEQPIKGSITLIR